MANLERIDRGSVDVVWLTGSATKRFVYWDASTQALATGTTQPTGAQLILTDELAKYEALALEIAFQRVDAVAQVLTWAANTKINAFPVLSSTHLSRMLLGQFGTGYFNINMQAGALSNNQYHELPLPTSTIYSSASGAGFKGSYPIDFATNLSANAKRSLDAAMWKIGYQLAFEPGEASSADRTMRIHLAEVYRRR